MELWLSVAERCRLEVDDIVHAALGGLKDQPAHDGDAVGAHAAEAYQREAIARLGLEVCDAQRRASPARTTGPTLWVGWHEAPTPRGPCG